MTSTPTFLDNFRKSYTFNWQTEKDSNGYNVCAAHEAIGDNVMKMLMWIPIISHIFATMLLYASVQDIKDYGSVSRSNILFISRSVIALTIPPLLIPIDLLGTLVKFCVDARKTATP